MATLVLLACFILLQLGALIKQIKYLELILKETLLSNTSDILAALRTVVVRPKSTPPTRENSSDDFT
jgi:hypothetical protein